MTITNVIFNNPDIDGNIVGNIFFQNGYGINLLLPVGTTEYELCFLIQNKDHYNLWVVEMDDNLLTVSQTNYLTNLSIDDVNSYISQVENLPTP